MIRSETSEGIPVDECSGGDVIREQRAALGLRRVSPSGPTPL